MRYSVVRIIQGVARADVASMTVYRKHVRRRRTGRRGGTKQEKMFQVERARGAECPRQNSLYSRPTQSGGPRSSPNADTAQQTAAELRTRLPIGSLESAAHGCPAISKPGK